MLLQYIEDRPMRTLERRPRHPRKDRYAMEVLCNMYKRSMRFQHNLGTRLEEPAIRS